VDDKFDLVLDLKKGIQRTKAIKRPIELPCDIHIVKNKETRFVVLAGLFEGYLYEIFVDELPLTSPLFQDIKNKELPLKGILKKEGKGDYTLICNNGIIIKNVAKEFNGTYGVLARLISMALRHGVMLPFIIQQLQRQKEFFSFEKAVSRVLKYYIKEEESNLVFLGTCKACGTKLEYKDGCAVCPQCGQSECE